MVQSYGKIPGVAVIWKPISGFYKLFTEFDGKDQHKALATRFEEHPDAKMFVTNLPGLGFGNVHVILKSSDAIKEYLFKEQTHASKNSLFELFTNKISGLEENKSRGFWRSVFTDFFNYDHLKLLCDPMYTIIGKHFNKFIKNQKITNTKFTNIDLHDFLGKIQADWIALLLFGFESVDELNID